MAVSPRSKTRPGRPPTRAAFRKPAADTDSGDALLVRLPTTDSLTGLSRKSFDKLTLITGLNQRRVVNLALAYLYSVLIRKESQADQKWRRVTRVPTDAPAVTNEEMRLLKLFEPPPGRVTASLVDLFGK